MFSTCNVMYACRAINVLFIFASDIVIFTLDVGNLYLNCTIFFFYQNRVPKNSKIEAFIVNDFCNFKDTSKCFLQNFKRIENSSKMFKCSNTINITK